MKRILVPTDLSAPSMASLKFAIDLASKAQADVYVLHVIQLRLLPETTFGIQPYRLDPEVLQKAILAANSRFEQVKKQLFSKVKVHFNTVNDHIVSGIREYIDDNNIDLVVISTHGGSDPQESLIGSTVEKITRSSPVPVISILKEIESDSIKNIVFPTMLELDQNDLIKDLKDLQKLLNARLHILLINSPLNFYSDRQASQGLEKFSKQYDLQDFTLNFRSHQFERSGILDFVSEIRGDMIAMATHGRTGLGHFFKGSITEALLTEIDQPIWTWNLKKHKQ